MAELISTIAMEEGTYVVTLSFTDETGQAVAPSAATWTLTDNAGTVINSRDTVTISSPATTVNIVLSGDDLAVQSGETGYYLERRILVEATYSSNLGTDLPMKWEGAFNVKNLTAVT